ncbi:MAG: response regulator [Bryobacteraceae bacterium]
MKHSRARILLVEDNPSDCEVVRRSIKRASIPIELVVATCGGDAFEILDGGAESQPDLIFVDLNLPDCDGREILRRMRDRSSGLHAPIVVLTTSDSPRDVNDCYQLGCNGFLVKPNSFTDYVQVLGATLEYWLCTAKLPRVASFRKQAAPG